MTTTSRDRGEFPCILQVSASDLMGGAAKIAWMLHEEYLRRGVDSYLAVGWKCSKDARVISINSRRSGWRRFWHRAAAWAASRRVPFVPGLARLLGSPTHEVRIRLGMENFDFPRSRRLLMSSPRPADLVHCHNLHGDYFDLRVLPRLSRRVPVILTLHDAWLLSGHCAHSFDCERWKTGCGQCPDLSIYPSIARDNTRSNWLRKQRIFAHSEVHVATPCRWLMNKVEQSMLRPRSARVIPNGVDLGVFKPADKRFARAELGLPQDSAIALFVGHDTKNNPWKDHKMMRDAVVLAARRNQGRPIMFVSLGERHEPEMWGPTRIIYFPYDHDAGRVALFYQAADVYLHAARVDTFPNTVLEALACGVPVVATAICGIPEQVADGRTGFLVPPGDALAMAVQLGKLLQEEGLRSSLAEAAVEDARRRFDACGQAGNYLDWYTELTESKRTEPCCSRSSALELSDAAHS